MSNNILNCPQCKSEINNTTNRLFQDECGHKKCRNCVMQDDLICKMCQENKNFIKNTSNDAKINGSSVISVIKYDGNKPNNANKDLSSENLTNNLTKKPKSAKNAGKKMKRQYKSTVIPSHVIIVTNSPLLYKCTICSKSFHSTSNINYHIYCNGVEKPFKCTECDKTFVRKSFLEIHIRSHTGNKPYQCDYCDKKFSVSGKLNRHLKIHSSNFEYVCPDCGKKFPTNDGLKIHLRLHSGEKPYKCNKCNSCFSDKSNLNKHLASHGSESIYICEQCGKKFKDKHSLSIHKKRHTLKKSFKCNFCGKGFLLNKELNRHMAIHKDIKIFNCSKCSTKFKRKDNLDRHLRNIHSASSESVNIIEKTNKSSSKITKNQTQENPPKGTKIETYQKDSKTLEVDSDQIVKEKSNAINVIKTNRASVQKVENGKNAVPVINGPIKLAFKNGTFKNNYNIHNRDFPELNLSKSFDTAKSLDIFHKILPPKVMPNSENLISQNRNVITSVGKVNEKDSLEICKKIFGSIDTPIHYETSFENKTHASIKNIKFKLPSTYTDNALKVSENRQDFTVSTENFPPQNNVSKVDNPPLDSDFDGEKHYTELKSTNLCGSSNFLNVTNFIEKIEYQKSVIVNPMNFDSEKNDFTPKFTELHWRKRNSQMSFSNNKN